MPAVELRCCFCGTPRDPRVGHAPRMVPELCACGASFRPMLTMFGAFRTRAIESGAPWHGPDSRVPKHTVIDCSFDNCRVAIRTEGPQHGRLDQVSITNTPVALELVGGATVDASRVYHSPGPRRPAG